ncbi:WD40 repeat domain-containing protein [Streptomyces vinaceus]|uniref:hypothetical protein n=1 Tax=Streptomyces vinaceus TaxID=1960 RepID=UPI0037F8936B
MSQYVLYVAHRGTGPGGNGVSIVDPARPGVIDTLPLGSLAPLAIFNSDANLAVLVDDSTELRTVDVPTFTLASSLDLNLIKGLPDRVQHIASSPDGAWLYLALGSRLHIVNAGTAQKTASVRAREAEEIQLIVPSPDNASVYTLQFGRISRFENTTGNELPGIGGMAYRALLIHPDGQAVYTVAGPLVIRLDSTTMQPTATRKMAAEHPRITLTPDGSRLCVSFTSVSNIPTMTTVFLDPVTLATKGTVSHAFNNNPQWTPDQKLVTTEDNIVAVIDMTENGQATGTELPGTAVGVAFAPPPTRHA